MSYENALKEKESFLDTNFDELRSTKFSKEKKMKKLEQQIDGDLRTLTSKRIYLQQLENDYERSQNQLNSKSHDIEKYLQSIDKQVTHIDLKSLK